LASEIHVCYRAAYLHRIGMQGTFPLALGHPDSHVRPNRVAHHLKPRQLTCLLVNRRHLLRCVLHLSFSAVCLPGCVLPSVIASQQATIAEPQILVIF
jgi:hypothetical protein